MRFSAVMRVISANPYIPVSASRARAIKAKKGPIPVLVQINSKPDEPWRINMMPKADGSYYLYLHGAVRKASATKVGDRVQVDVRFDANYRNGPMHLMPSWFRIPLSKNAKAKKGWDALIPSRKKEILRYFSWLKSPEARTRNVKRALSVLSGAKERFMARSWSAGK